MTALVTGGGGFLGSAIIGLLLKQGARVRSYSRKHHTGLDSLGVEQSQGDLTDANALGQAVRGCDIVYHVAAQAGVWGRYGDYYRTNVVGTQNVLNACTQSRVAKLVYTSSPSVVYDGGDMEGVNESAPYPKKHEAHYPATKAIAEQLVLANNGPRLATVSLRPHLIWGPGDPHLIPRLIDRARSGKLRRIGNHAKRVDTIYIDNAALAHVLAGNELCATSACAGKAYFLSQGEPVNLWDFINRILACAGLPPVEKTISYRKAWYAGAVLETIYRVLRLRKEPPMTRFVARQLATAHWFDISAAKRDFGYTPVVSTEEGLRMLAASLK